MSYAMLRSALDTRGLWSFARGLARQVDVYKNHLAACDAPRRGDLDGRGNLSQKALAEFAGFFLQTCIDQVEFMADLMQAERLRDRVMIWTEEQMRANTLPLKSDSVLRAVLHDGKLERGQVDALLGISSRSARRITSALLDAGVLTSQSSRAPLFLAFPAKFAGRLAFFLKRSR